jgi:DNA-binding transcriptional MerR regulator
MSKTESAYKTIGEVVKILGLKNKSGSKLPTHTIRFWGKSFKQIKPKVLNNKHRYYDKKNIDLLKKVKFLLKDQGMTIKGAKKVLNDHETNDLDEVANKSISAYNIKVKLKKLSKLIKTLKY